MSFSEDNRCTQNFTNRKIFVEFPNLIMILCKRWKAHLDYICQSHMTKGDYEFGGGVLPYQ